MDCIENSKTGPNYLMPTLLAPIVRPPRPGATDGCQENAHFPFSQVEQSFGAYPTSLCYFLPSPPLSARAASKVFISVKELAALSDILPDNVA